MPNLWSFCVEKRRDVALQRLYVSNENVSGTNVANINIAWETLWCNVSANTLQFRIPNSTIRICKTVSFKKHKLPCDCPCQVFIATNPIKKAAFRGGLVMRGGNARSVFPLDVGCLQGFERKHIFGCEIRRCLSHACPQVADAWQHRIVGGLFHLIPYL